MKVQIRDRNCCNPSAPITGRSTRETNASTSEWSHHPARLQRHRTRTSQRTAWRPSSSQTKKPMGERCEPITATFKLCKRKFGKHTVDRFAGEWNGPWSERSWEWDSLAERDKELLAVRVRNEGEFWMAFEDFASQFSHLDLVHIGPDDWMSEQALHSKRPWRAVLARRRWR